MKDTEIVVYFIGDKPNTIYKVWNKPEIGDIPYCTIEGWWKADESGTYKFEENISKTICKWDKSWLMNKIIPDISATKCFDNFESFILDQL